MFAAWFSPRFSPLILAGSSPTTATTSGARFRRPFSPYGQARSSSNHAISISLTNSIRPFSAVTQIADSTQTTRCYKQKQRELHCDSLEAGVGDTVQHGGDTDTIRRHRGGLIGSRARLVSHSQQWLDRVLTCRPIAKLSLATPVRVPIWPVDAWCLAEYLLLAGGAKNVRSTG